MNYLTNKNKIILSSLLLFSSMASQTVLAASSYNSTAEITYTINATNQNITGDLTNLDIFEDTLDFSPVFASSSSLSSSTIENFTGLGTTFTQIFQAEDSIINGFATSEYLAQYVLAFENISTNPVDIFDITIDYSYQLTTTANGENADTTVDIAYSNEDFSLDGGDLAETSLAGNINDSPISLTDSFSFTLLNGEIDNLYVDTTISGTLEATSAVPIPAAFWLFGSALIAFPGIRKFKITRSSPTV